jgi:hypothetical protein
VPPEIDDDAGMVSCEEAEEIEVPAGGAEGAAAGRSMVCSCGKPKACKGYICKKCGVRRDEPAVPNDAPDDEDGFMDAILAEGSLHAVKVRMGSQTDHLLCCDILVPAGSFNASETLAPGRTLMISVFSDARGGLKANINDDVLDLRRGDNCVVKPGSAYSLRNDSETHSACVKMVMITA